MTTDPLVLYHVRVSFSPKGWTEAVHPINDVVQTEHMLMFSKSIGSTPTRIRRNELLRPKTRLRPETLMYSYFTYCERPQIDQALKELRELIRTEAKLLFERAAQMQKVFDTPPVEKIFVYD